MTDLNLFDEATEMKTNSTGCPHCDTDDDIEPDVDYPDTMMNCHNCGAEWSVCDGEMTLDPAEVA